MPMPDSDVFYNENTIIRIKYAEACRELDALISGIGLRSKHDSFIVATKKKLTTRDKLGNPV